MNLLITLVRRLERRLADRGITERDGELEALVSRNVREWADRIREGERIERMFQRIA